MRRKDREVTDPERIASIIADCRVLRVAICDSPAPYIVPVNFGFADDGQRVFYFHCAHEGKKLDLIKKNPLVGFEADCRHELTEGASPCGGSYLYASIIGYGTARIVSDIAEKKRALTRLFLHQTGRNVSFNDVQAASVTVCCIDVQEMTVKENRAE